MNGSWYEKNIASTERSEGDADFGAVESLKPSGPSKLATYGIAYLVGAGVLAVVGSVVSTAFSKE